IASLRTGYKRIGELCDKYTVEVVKESMKRLLEQGSLVAYKRIKELPKGSWDMEEYMDDDGHGNPVKLKVKVTI
ncbi:MAG: hydantoinase B/oxoprolinase family protein, partial [Lachnospiraceae bacterium]